MAKFPFATLLLFSLVVVPYWYFSGGTFYLSTDFLDRFAFGASAEGVVTHLSVHVGIFHLLGNLIPLVLFALLLEATLSAFDVLLVFFSAGLFSSLLFSFLNPGAFLIGASAAISGLMSAATVLRPKRALFLLVATPILIFLIIFPIVSSLVQWHEKSLAEKQIVLQQNLTQLIKEKRFVEAQQVNASLQVTQKQVQQSIEGKIREETTPTDVFVHAFGALVGVVIVFAFRKKKLAQGVREFEDLGEKLFAVGKKVKGFFKRTPKEKRKL